MLGVSMLGWMQLSHGDKALALTPRRDLNAIGDKREDSPAAVEKYPCHNDETSGDRTDGGALPEIPESGQRHRVDREFPVIRDGLDEKDPCVRTAKPSADRTGEVDVVARFAIVLGQQFGPTRI